MMDLSKGFKSQYHLGGALTMKFKQSDGQNQRIERITTSHLVVGIDIAKETHYFARVTHPLRLQYDVYRNLKR